MPHRVPTEEIGLGVEAPQATLVRAVAMPRWAAHPVNVGRDPPLTPAATTHPGLERRHGTDVVLCAAAIGTLGALRAKVCMVTISRMCPAVQTSQTR